MANKLALRALGGFFLLIGVSGGSPTRAAAMSCLDVFALESVLIPGPSSASPSKGEIEDHVLAVSALREVPRDGVVRANAVDYNTREKNGAPESLVRFGVHAALGEMVRPHGPYSWEDRKIAVVHPLKELGGLISLNPYDTMILGDVKLNKNSVLIVPQGSQVDPVRCNCQVVEYNPEKTTLRAAIDDVVKSRGGWSIRMQAEREQQIDAEFEINGRTYKTSQFFRNFLKDKPHVSVGMEGKSLNGQAFRFGYLSQFLVRTFDSFRYMGNEYGSIFQRLMLRVLEHHLAKVRELGDETRIPLESRKSFLEQVSIFEGMLNILRLDVYLRERYDLRLSGSFLPPEIWQARADLDRIKHYVDSKPDFRQSLNRPYNILIVGFIAYVFSTLPKDERASFQLQYPSLIPSDVKFEFEQELKESDLEYAKRGT
jgi:hypothetical protein